MPKPAYSFLPWLRNGLANRLTAEDELGVDNGDNSTTAPTIDLSLIVKGDGQPVPDGTIKKTIHLYGPGDIIGMAPAAVIKTQPRSGTMDFEPNFLPYIEFYEEDFPWRYTPLKNKENRLRPWLMLVVLEAASFERSSVQKGDVLPSIALKAPADQLFPPADQLWAWAHTHVNAGLGLTGNRPADAAEQDQALHQLGESIRNDPNRSCSRILCPIKLKPQTEYAAFLIPTFERGRLAGLGRKTAEIEAVSIQMPAWGRSPRQTQFPYYYDWRFRTSEAEDFEALVRRIEPRHLNRMVGKRWIDIQDPGYNIHYQVENPQDAEGAVNENHLLSNGAILMEGALRLPGTELPSFLAGEVDKDENWLVYLEGLINLETDMKERNLAADHPFAQNPYFGKPAATPEDDQAGSAEELNDSIYDDPLILPPMYGRWHAAQDRVDRTAENYWFDQLNLDPRHRVAAGLGAEVVRRHQEDYMDRAWKQFDSLFKINDYLRKTAFAAAVTGGLVKRHFQRPSESGQAWRVAAISEGMQTVVGAKDAGALNLRSYIRPRAVPDALLSAASEKVANANRMLLKRARRQSGTTTTTVRHRGAGRSTPSLSSVSLIGVSPTTFRQVIKYEFPISGNQEPQPTGGATSGGGLSTTTSEVLTNVDPDDPEAQDLGFGNLVEAALNNATDHRATYLKVSGISGPNAKKIFHKALSDLNKSFHFQDEKPTVGQIPDFDFNTAGRLVVAAIQPEVSFGKKVNHQLSVTNAEGETTALTTISPIMQAPNFPDAMYEPLEAVASEHLVPNVDLIPPNTYALMETNRAFIEAFMAGLNFEMARELLWREFPTDQRGTYFKRFWAQREGLAAAAIKKDIQVIHEWTGPLGTHPDLSNPAGAKKRMVLLIRADLLRRYPNVIVYMQKAKIKNGQRTLDTSETPIYSSFFAQIQPDIYFVGFDMTVQDARKDEGHFFVLRERPGELRFGLDLPPEKTEQQPPAVPWDDLHWGELTGAHPYIDLSDTKDQPEAKEERVTMPWPTSADGNAAEMAWILQQKPILVAVHIETIRPDWLLSQSSTTPGL